MKMTKFDILIKEVDVEEEEKEESQWSQLPALILWMIKDLLLIADNVRLAFVCKNWESMSLRYLSDPIMGQRYCVGPWMMHQSQNPTTCWDYVNVKTMERLTLKPPRDYYDHIVILFSRQGWLLYQVGSSIILYHIHTNVKIILPEAPAEYTKYGFIGTFSTFDDDDDSPCCIVLVPLFSLSGVLYIASVGDKEWTLHFNKERGQEHQVDTRGILAASLVVHGQKLYLFYMVKGIIISCDMTTRLRKKLDDQNYSIKTNKSQIRCWLMESDGELVKIDQHIDSNTFSLFKLNDSKTGWEELIQNEQDNRSWVLYHQHQNLHCAAHGFSIKQSDGGKKLYQLTSNYYRYEDVGPIMHIHDLISGSVEEYKTDQDGTWVDLGFINKVPPSCISASAMNMF